MISQASLKRLNKVYNEASKISINDEDKYVIISDFHMGNGGSNDDFANNSELVTKVLQDYYFKKQYKLILNGDIEELYKFSLKNIYKRWQDVYKVFDMFNQNDSLYKIYGNHDYDLVLKYKTDYQYPLYQGLRLEYDNNTIFIYHGHQTASIFEQYSRFIFFLVRYLLRSFSNDSIPIENGKKFKTEKIAYEYSRQNNIISILGHTHRPVFESLSKIESLKMLIERLLKKYQKATAIERKFIELQIRKFKDELAGLYGKNIRYNMRSSIYDDKLLLPFLFNSGCATGKRGINAIEIKNGKIYLIYWFDKNRSIRYLNYENVTTKRLDKTDIYRAVLKKDSLSYIFSRIKLLN